MIKNKRFEFKSNEETCSIIDWDKKWLATFDKKYKEGIQVVCNELNTLYEENEAYKLKIQEISSYDISDLLNKQDKHIFLLQSVIQTITAEAYEKPLSSERITEIKDYWYEKIINEVLK